MNEHASGRSRTGERKFDLPEIEALRAELAETQQRLEESACALAMSGKRENILRNEIGHRVRNALAMVRSVFSRTIESSHSIEDMGHHFVGRFDTIARIHGRLAVGRLGGGDLEEIIREELRGFEFDERIAITGDEVAVGNAIAP